MRTKGQELSKQGGGILGKRSIDDIVHRSWLLEIGMTFEGKINRVGGLMQNLPLLLFCRRQRG